MLALNSAVATAAGLPDPGRFDFGSALMLRLFGETSDSRASFAAARGDRASESPFRELALGVGPSEKSASPAAVAFGEARLSLRDLAAGQSAAFTTTRPVEESTSVIRFSMPPLTDSATLVPPSAHFTVAYQPVAPVPAISPAPGTLAFLPPQINAAEFTPTTTQLGAVRFEERSQSATAAQPALGDTSYAAGADFDVRAGKRNVNFNLSTEYEHVGQNDAQTFSVSAPSTAATWQLPTAGSPLVIPSYADMNRLSLGAGVSVPVVHGLTLNVKYDAQRFYGGYGLPGLLNLDTVNNTYGGNLTFNIPHISSSLSIGAYQDRFQDSLLSINGQTQTREDVNFTVKF
jgi:hypothetical protein